MTTTDTTSVVTTVDTRTEPVFLWGPGYELTARQILDALGSYLATFGDNFGPGGVCPLDAIHAEVVYTGDYTHWQHRRTPAQIAVIRARAQAIAAEFFHGHFPTVTW
jgi:hypothetical protein